MGSIPLDIGTAHGPSPDSAADSNPLRHTLSETALILQSCEGDILEVIKLSRCRDAGAV